MQAVLWFTSRGLRNRGRIVKVVLFCGGFGTRLREYSETIPKPLVDVGHRPIIWHLMKYYEHHGHSDFILCLGYQGRMIKEYFLNYDECMSNDFVMTEGGKNVELYNRDIDNWRITFVDTGLNANLGERLLAVRKYLGDDEFFLANYSDGLSDLPLLDHIEMTQDRRALAGFVAVRPSQTYSRVLAGDDGRVTSIDYISGSDVWINGGFFVLNKAIFDYMRPGEELVEQPFGRLIEERKLYANRYGGFWGAIDTFKDKKRFDDLCARDETPWMVWNGKAAV